MQIFDLVFPEHNFLMNVCLSLKIPDNRLLKNVFEFYFLFPKFGDKSKIYPFLD
jgi:hypothetical protein